MPRILDGNRVRDEILAELKPRVAALAAKTMGVKLEIVQITAPARIPTLVNGQADIMLGGFAITAPRTADGAFALDGIKDLRIGWSRAAADTTLASIDSKIL